ncbi:MAG: hypothetical protein ACYTFG_14400 [Planctomycetota bacterium]|jgi:hypothetical protein
MSDWQEVGGRVVRPRIVDKERDALLKLKEALEQQVEKLGKGRDLAREHLHRIRHGGGS